jgi:hypothetical protein
MRGQPSTSLSEDANVCTLRTNGWHIEGLRLNGWLWNSFSIANARVNNPRDYAWLVQRESIGYPD